MSYIIMIKILSEPTTFLVCFYGKTQCIKGSRINLELNINLRKSYNLDLLFVCVYEMNDVYPAWQMTRQSWEYKLIIDDYT